MSMTRLAATLFVALLALAGCEAPGTTSNPNADAGIISAFQAGPIRLRHVDAINALRSERGLQPLQMSAQLIAAAETHARDIANQQRAWDFGSDGSSPQTRAERAGYVGVVRGENVAETFKGDLFVLQTWLQGGPSRQVILDPQATHIGLGWYQESNGKLWWVQVIGQQRSAAPVATAQLQ